jgi:opine dehydrogenase
MDKKPTIAVLGAGSGGACMTADLIEQGFKVNLYELPQFEDSMQPFVDRGGIEITGKITGFYEPNMMTTNMEEALEGVDIATMNVRAFAHGLFVEKAVPHLKKGQILHCWTPYAFALRYYETLKEKAPGAIIAESAILPYFVKRDSPDVINCHAYKLGNFVAAMPSDDTGKVLKALAPAMTTRGRFLKPATNVLATSILNGNITAHIPAILLNAREYEDTMGHVYIYGKHGTPLTKKVAYAIRDEAAALCTHLGLETSLRCPYPPTKPGEPTLASHTWWAPDVSMMDLGCLQEDLPYGTVLLAELGRALGVPTPVSRGVTDMFKTMLDVDYWKVDKLGNPSANLEALGLEGLTKKEILRYVTTGEKPSKKDE